MFNLSGWIGSYIYMVFCWPTFSLMFLQYTSTYRVFSLTWPASMQIIITNEIVCIRKQFNSKRIGLWHQHRRRFTVRVKAGMSLRNGMWHGLRNDIIMRNLICAAEWSKEIKLKRAPFFGANQFANAAAVLMLHTMTIKKPRRLIVDQP